MFDEVPHFVQRAGDIALVDVVSHELHLSLVRIRVHDYPLEDRAAQAFVPAVGLQGLQGLFH